MVDVLVTFRVLPDSVETDLKLLAEQMKAIRTAELHGLEEEPIAFGLVALRPSFAAEDAEDAVEGIERELRKIEGVSEVDVLEVTRLLG